MEFIEHGLQSLGSQPEFFHQSDGLHPALQEPAPGLAAFFSGMSIVHRQGEIPAVMDKQMMKRE